MPYICLARNDIPDGVVQILSLIPNSSQRHPGYDPPGQTRYLNRVASNPVLFKTTGATLHDTDGLIAYLVDRVEPAGGTWTHANQQWIAGAILARLDAGAPMLVANLNTIIQVIFAASDFDGSSSSSTGVLTELLDILAGRGYRLPAGYLKGPGGAWSATQRGAFTYDATVYGTTLQHGEIRPATAGGDTVQLEVRGITETYILMGHTKSIGATDLVCFSGGSPQISAPTLWPDKNIVPIPHYPWEVHGGLAYTTVTNARVITIYDVDGSVL